METIIFATVIVVLAVGAIWFYNRSAKDLDINKDGRVDAKDAIAAAKITVDRASADLRDTRDSMLVAAAESAMKAAGVLESATKANKTTVKRAANKAKTATKKTVAKATAVKKPRTKK